MQVPPKLAVVFGTYNRLEFLKRAVTAIRNDIALLVPYKMVIIDGGSSDGSREFLKQQVDVDLIEQEGPLTGAVRAFNLGFAKCVDEQIPFVAHFNDDAEFASPRCLPTAIELLEQNPKWGEIAFAINTWESHYGFDYCNGVPYANFGVIRLACGMAVARAQGDTTGKNWWNPIYHTYAADTEFGVWLWKLGHRVHPVDSLRVNDLKADDALRASNSGDKRDADSKLFWARWHNESLKHLWNQIK